MIRAPDKNKKPKPSPKPQPIPKIPRGPIPPREPRGEPIPLPPRTTPPPRDFPPYDDTRIPVPPRTTPPPQDFPPYDRSIPTGEVPILQQGTPQIPPGGGFVPPATTIDELISRQTYQNLLQQQMANAAAQGKPIGMQPQQPAQPVRTSQQAMQNYQNLVGQGIANMQAMGRITPPGQLPSQPQRKTSTQSFQTPRPFG